VVASSAFVSFPSLTDGVITTVGNVIGIMRFSKIEITGTDIGNFEADFEIYEFYDGNETNALDASILRFGGSTSQDSTVNQTDPITITISDGNTLLHPPRYFDIEEAKFLTAEITALRTGQQIIVDNVMTLQTNYSPAP